LEIFLVEELENIFTSNISVISKHARFWENDDRSNNLP
jgi:hypothetical protein